MKGPSRRRGRCEPSRTRSPTFQTMARPIHCGGAPVERLLVGVSIRGRARILEPFPADIPVGAHASS